jgi:hypothetical protein
MTVYQSEKGGKQDELRRCAFTSLAQGKNPCPAFYPTLRQIVDATDSSDDERAAAVSAISYFADRREESLILLKRLVSAKETTDAVRAAALCGICRLAPQSPGTLAMLKSALTTNNGFRVRYQAATLLYDTGLSNNASNELSEAFESCTDKESDLGRIIVVALTKADRNHVKAEKLLAIIGNEDAFYHLKPDAYTVLSRSSDKKRGARNELFECAVNGKMEMRPLQVALALVDIFGADRTRGELQRLQRMGFSEHATPLLEALFFLGH